MGGQYIAISAQYEDVTSGGVTYEKAGRVYVYVTPGYKLLNTLVSGNLKDYSQFGFQVATDRGYVVVGSPFEYSDDGTVYVFK